MTMPDFITFFAGIKQTLKLNELSWSLNEAIGFCQKTEVNGHFQPPQKMPKIAVINKSCWQAP